MGRLVELNAAIEAAVEYIEAWNGHLSAYHRRKITEKCMKLPPVDATQVIRCYECKRQKVDCPMRYSGIDYPSDNSFCGWGKKKSG